MMGLFRIESKQARAGERVKGVNHTGKLSDGSGFVESLMRQNVSDCAINIQYAIFVMVPDRNGH